MLCAGFGHVELSAFEDFSASGVQGGQLLRHFINHFLNQAKVAVFDVGLTDRSISSAQALARYVRIKHELLLNVISDLFAQKVTPLLELLAEAAGRYSESPAQSEISRFKSASPI